MNHLSDSVSIVDVTTPAAARVVRTLLVGDEPRDLVFAGPGNNRAFITTAHRGQNTPLHPTIETVLTTPGIGRADVWVFDAANLGATLGGTPLTIVTLFGDTPRALTVSPDGGTVYAAVFHSGNRTTTLSEGVVPNGGPGAGGLPAPNTNFDGTPGPEVGLIVQYDGTKWTDELGRNWNSTVKFTLPDKDVFAIDANANPPIQVAGPSGFYTGVGTILFNMVTNPVSGKVYVANLESLNRVRFEGEGVYASGFKPLGEPASVRGHLAESRITVLDGASVLPRHLNKHIDYTTCCAPLPNTENDDSIAFPTRHGGLERRRHPLRRRLRLERGRRLQHGADRGQHVHPLGREPARRLRRRPDGSRARRGADAPLRDDAFRRLDLRAQHGHRLRAAARGAPQSRARERRRRPADPLRHDASARATATRRARAATSSATSTASRGISAIPTTSCSTTPVRSRFRPSSIPTSTR